MVGLLLHDYLDIDIGSGFKHTSAHPSVIPQHLAIGHQAMQKVDIKAAGVKHFTWVLDMRTKHNGENLYPLFAERWAAMDASFEPLTRRLYSAFGLLPVAGDEHLCEYLPWVSDPVTKPWEKLDLDLYDWDLWDQLRVEGHIDIAKMADGTQDIESLKDEESEGALEIIENIAGAGTHYQLSVNVPNRGYILNLPENAIVEIPGVVSGAGVQGLGMASLPEGIAELCRRELTVSQLCVDAAVRGDRNAALQCLLLDPVIRDMDIASQILDEYLITYREYLPQFWT